MHLQLCIDASSGSRLETSIWPTNLLKYGCELGNFRRKISGNLFESFRKCVNCVRQSAVSKSSNAKRCCNIGIFLKHNSPDLYVSTFIIMFGGKNNSFLARLQGISANLKEKYRRIKFRKYQIFGRFTLSQVEEDLGQPMNSAQITAVDQSQCRGRYDLSCQALQH